MHSHTHYVLISPIRIYIRVCVYTHKEQDKEDKSKRYVCVYTHTCMYIRIGLIRTYYICTHTHTNTNV